MKFQGVGLLTVWILLCALGVIHIWLGWAIIVAIIAFLLE
jgi:hypothetical protein